MARAVFLVDAAVSATYALLLLSILLKALMFYKAHEWNVSISERVNAALMESNDWIARGLKKEEGGVCIVRYVGEKEVFCVENA